MHLKNVFASGELEKNFSTEEISAIASDGKNYKMNFFNLDAIISVVYRVNSAKAAKFRIRATGKLVGVKRTQKIVPSSNSRPPRADNYPLLPHSPFVDSQRQKKSSKCFEIAF